MRHSIAQSLLVADDAVNISEDDTVFFPPMDDRSQLQGERVTVSDFCMSDGKAAVQAGPILECRGIRR